MDCYDACNRTHECPICPNNPESILTEVVEERRRQAMKWSSEHDDAHGHDHFNGLIKLWLYKVEQADDVELIRKRFVEIAALAVSAIEVIDRQEPQPS